MSKIAHIKPEWFIKRKPKPKKKLRPIPLRSLLSIFRPTLVQLLVSSTGVFILLRIQSTNRIASYILASILALFLVHRSRWFWPLLKRISGFVPHESSGVQLFYDSNLGATFRPSDVVGDCQRHLRELSTILGIPARRRLLVFLFANWADISKIFGESCAATALPKFNAIVISNNDYIQQTIRHELTHLLVSRWRSTVPPLLGEGIATWLEGNRWGQSIDLTALAILLNSPPSLDSLLQRQFFFSKASRERCYVLAGSFTGYLIQHYGWDRYKRLYQHLDSIAPRLSFKQLMGGSLQTVEADWHEYIKSGRWSKKKTD